MSPKEINVEVRACLRDPIPEIFTAAKLLDDAVAAHLEGLRETASKLIIAANLAPVREWTESLWGKNSPYVKVCHIEGGPPSLPKAQRIKVRMPTSAEKEMLHERDGFHCRFCGIPLIRMEIRKRIRFIYPDALPWGRNNLSQHAAFQAMWLQYDHLLPHARGGTNDIENIVLTCAPCNYGRWHHLVEEVGVADPRARQPIRSEWGGLEHFC